MSAYNIPQCLVRMKFQSQEPIIFVPLHHLPMKTAGILFYQNPIDGSFNIYLLMATIICICLTTQKTAKAFFHRSIHIYNLLPYNYRIFNPKKFNKEIKGLVRNKFSPDRVPYMW